MDYWGFWGPESLDGWMTRWMDGLWCLEIICQNMYIKSGCFSQKKKKNITLLLSVTFVKQSLFTWRNAFHLVMLLKHKRKMNKGYKWQLYTWIKNQIMRWNAYLYAEKTFALCWNGKSMRQSPSNADNNRAAWSPKNGSRKMIMTRVIAYSVRKFS